MCAQPLSHSTHQTIRFIQHNTAKSTSVMQTLLHLSRKSADIILIQEPWVRFDDNSGSWTTISHPSFLSIIPTTQLKPRVITFISKTSTHITLTPRSDLSNDPDVQCLSLSFNSGHPTLLLNIYNEKSQAPDNDERTMERCVCTIPLPDKAIAVGDFNAHHQWWNSSIRTPKRADNIITWTDAHNLQLLNEEDIPTYNYRNGTGTSVLDLTFATPTSTESITSWAVDDEATTGSDHEVIRFEHTIATLEDTVPHPACQQFNFRKADWNHFSTSLSNLAQDAVQHMKQHLEQTTDSGLEEAATILRDTLLQAANESIPLLRPSPRSKSWWNDDLTSKRRLMHQHKRRWKTTRGDQEWSLFQQTRNSYFYAIREAKRTDWQTFLSSAKGKDVFTAYKYTKPRRVERTPILHFQGREVIDFRTKCDTFRQAMFPPPPEAPAAPPIPPGPTLEWPDVTPQEIAAAIQTSTPNKASGQDGLPFLLLQKAYQAAPELFNILYPTLIEHGYHPLCWRQATGAILNKHNNPDYTAPKPYRIIALSNCLGKISEKIIATRLSYLAESTTLLHHEQMGGRRYRSAMDAILCLLHDITQANKNRKILSILFFDVKGAFDHVSKSRLLDTMKRLHLDPAVIRWTDSFLSHRQIGLAFDGEREDLQSVNTGIPQGSPISPILFLIYLRFLFTTIQERHPNTATPSYIDDVACLVVGDSEEENCRKLEAIAQTAFEWGDNNAVAFDDPKTELIHFHRRQHTPQCSVILPNGTIIKPSTVVRWLGVFFDRKLSFRAHIDRKIASASRALQLTRRLKTSEWGLSSQHLRQLYTSCVIPILDYGAEAWWRGQRGYTDRLQKLQNTACRRILGAFRTSPVIPMELEASLPPTSIRLQQKCRNYAIRSMTLPEDHPIRQRTSSTFPPEYPSGVEVDYNQSDRDTMYRTHSQLWRSHFSIVSMTPSSTQLERINHLAHPPGFNPLDPARATIKIPKQKKEEVAESHISLVNSLVNNPSHLLIYTDGSQTTDNSNGTGLVAIHANHHHREGKWNLGCHVEVYDTELFGILQATSYARQWIQQDPQTRTIWIFVDNQAAIRRCLSPQPTAGQHLALQIQDNIAMIIQSRSDIMVNIQWVPGHTAIFGNEKADKCAKSAAALPRRCGDAFTSIAYIKRQVRQDALQSWHQTWQDSNQGSAYCSLAKGQPLWGPTWKPTKFPNTDQTTASTIHQLRLGHGYFKSFLVRLPQYTSSECQCSARIQDVKHLLLGCPLYKDERKKVGITRKTTISSLLFTQKGATQVADFIKATKIAGSDGE